MRITYFDTFRGPNEYDFLSNFYPSPIKLLGRRYKTGEHAFQAFKATTVRDHDFVRRAKTPASAKDKGRHIPLRKDWEAVKYDVMRQVLRVKFAPGSTLSYRLLGTGSAMLVEGTDWNDKVWGVAKPSMRGRNWLGHLLMARRAELSALETSLDDEEDFTVALAYIRIPEEA